MGEGKKKADPEAAVVPVIPVDTSPEESPSTSRPASSRTTITEAPQDELQAEETADPGDVVDDNAEEIEGDVEAPLEEVEANPDNEEMGDDPPAEEDMGGEDMMDD